MRSIKSSRTTIWEFEAKGVQVTLEKKEEDKYRAVIKGASVDRVLDIEIKTESVTVMGFSEQKIIFNIEETHKMGNVATKPIFHRRTFKMVRYDITDEYPTITDDEIAGNLRNVILDNYVVREPILAGLLRGDKIRLKVPHILAKLFRVDYVHI